tara:strand:- start:1289 stop:2197 length:909 start_codon:yes stop_codon:yes gene_type:complete
MKKKIITKISEGLGNQLFMYANGFALSKKNDLEFFIDPYSGYFKKKHAYKFFLNRFNITSKFASQKYVFDDYFKHIFKKLLIINDNFNKYKKFVFEKKGWNKQSRFSPIDLSLTKNIFFLDGNFESEKYFIDFRSELLSEFVIKNIDVFSKNKYLSLIQNNNVVSICVRQNRFSERIKNKNDKQSILKSKRYVEETVDYIYRSISYFDKKLKNPLYLVWSNDFIGLEKYFDTQKFVFVRNHEDKVLTDFYLLTKCKYFIVGPSTFHWWGAWLSTRNDKICLRPKNINPSKNIDFWPEKWISI